MGGIFGFTLLNGHKMTKTSIHTLVTELLRSQVSPVKEIHLMAMTDAHAHVITSNMSVTRFVATKDYAEFLDKVWKDKRVYSFLGAFKDNKNSSGIVDTENPMAIHGNAICVQKEAGFTEVTSGGDVVAEILDRYNFSLDITSRIRAAAKDVKIYAGVNTGFPSTLLLAKHTADPLKMAMFAKYGVFIFSSIDRSIDKVLDKLLLGKKEDVDMFAQQSFLLCMNSNKYRVMNTYSGQMNYAIN